MDLLQSNSNRFVVLFALVSTVACHKIFVEERLLDEPRERLRERLAISIEQSDYCDFDFMTHI